MKGLNQRKEEKTKGKMLKLIKKAQILFWKTYAILWDLRPRKHLPKFVDRPIASTPLIEGQKEYPYPEGVKVLFEWEEKGHKWIVFSR